MIASRVAVTACLFAISLPQASAWCAEPITLIPAVATPPAPFSMPKVPDDSPTVTPERIIVGSVGGLLAGFGVGMAAGIIHYNWARRSDPGQPTLSDGSMTKGLRYGGMGAFAFLLVFGGYAAYSVPHAPAPEIYPFMDRPRSSRDKGEPGTSAEPLAAAIAKADEFTKTHPVKWITGVDQDGERLLVRVGEGYDSASPDGRRKAIGAVFDAYQSARKVLGLPAAGEIWLRGGTFLERWAPPSE